MALMNAAEMRKWWQAEILPVVMKKVDALKEEGSTHDDAKRMVRAAFTQFSKTIGSEM